MKNALALIYHPGTLSIEGELLERLQKKSIREREEGLMLAILEDAIHCFFKYLLAKDEKGRQLFRETEKWLLEKNSDWLFSFENICETLGLNPSYLREGLMRWKESELLKNSNHKAKVYPFRPRQIPSQQKSFV